MLELFGLVIGHWPGTLGQDRAFVFLAHDPFSLPLGRWVQRHGGSAEMREAGLHGLARVTQHERSASPAGLASRGAGTTDPAGVRRSRSRTRRSTTRAKARRPRVPASSGRRRRSMFMSASPRRSVVTALVETPRDPAFRPA